MIHLLTTIIAGALGGALVGSIGYLLGYSVGQTPTRRQRDADAALARVEDMLDTIIEGEIDRPDAMWAAFKIDQAIRNDPVR